jgi:hypothetical protein
MIRDAGTVALALASLAWAARLLWLGAPVPAAEEAPLRPWIDEGCSTVVHRALEELEPKLDPEIVAEPSPHGIAAARAALLESDESAPSPAALAVARCLDAAVLHGVELRWTRAAPGAPTLEAEFRASPESAVTWWEALLRAAADGQALAPRSWRWTLLGPLSVGARAEIVGRARFALRTDEPGEDAR